jgi:ElaB/YqjD/DUF883 family membrane-anchored ribosome-binding protein
MAQTILENQATVDDIFREVNRIKTVVTEAVDDGVQSAFRAMKQGREAAEDAVHDARTAIKRNPLQSAGVLLGVGILIGCLAAFLAGRRD